MADPDLQMGGGGGGGVLGGHPAQEIRKGGWSLIFFFRPSPQFGLKIMRGNSGPPRPSPRSATAI